MKNKKGSQKLFKILMAVIAVSMIISMISMAFRY